MPPATLALLVVCAIGAFLVPGMIIRHRLAAIDTIVTEQIEANNFPGAVICVGRRNKVHYLKAFGHEVIEPFKEPAEVDTIFDLASLTKPIATATSVMILIDEKKLSPKDKVAKFIPAFASNGKEEVLIKHLLTHTSGLPAYTSATPLKEKFGNPCRKKVIEKICQLEAKAKPGEKLTYSCLGYIILAKIVEIVSEQPVDEFAKERIFEPLGMTDTYYNPPASVNKRIAATEIVDEKLLRGTVHDPLAQLMEGRSGNAGVFSTASDLAVFCRMILGGGVYKGRRILSEEAVTLMRRSLSHGRGYGFDMSSSYSWIKGSFTSDQAFCHSGYTGTSIVCDPETNVFVIILTNRAHPHDKGASKPVRTKVADIAFAAFGGVQH